MRSGEAAQQLANSFGRVFCAGRNEGGRRRKNCEDFLSSVWIYLDCVCKLLFLFLSYELAEERSQPFFFFRLILSGPAKLFPILLRKIVRCLPICVSHSIFFTGVVLAGWFKRKKKLHDCQGSAPRSIMRKFILRNSGGSEHKSFNGHANCRRNMLESFMHRVTLICWTQQEWDEFLRG